MARTILISLVFFVLAACAEWQMLSTNEVLVPDEALRRVSTQTDVPPPTAAQKEAFGILADFPGHMFRGEPTGDNSEALADYQLWSWTEDGAALMIRHALEDGSYGGETIVRPGTTGDELTYVYYTNGGFSTQGHFTVSEEGVWEAVEEVTGQGDITKVRSRGHRREDGALISKSEYFSNGEWVPGHGFVYREVWQDMPELKTPIER